MNGKRSTRKRRRWTELQIRGCLDLIAKEIWALFSMPFFSTWKGCISFGGLFILQPNKKTVQAYHFDCRGHVGENWILTVPRLVFQSKLTAKVRKVNVCTKLWKFARCAQGRREPFPLRSNCHWWPVNHTDIARTLTHFSSDKQWIFVCQPTPLRTVFENLSRDNAVTIPLWIIQRVLPLWRVTLGNHHCAVLQEMKKKVCTCNAICQTDVHWNFTLTKEILSVTQTGRSTYEFCFPYQV